MTTVTITDTSGDDQVALAASQTQVVFDYQGGADRITFGGSATGMLHLGTPDASTVTGGAGGDILWLSGGGTVTLSGVETISGTAGIDWVTASGGGTLTANGVETLVGAAAMADAVSLEAAQSGGIVNLLGGGDSLTLADGLNQVSAFNVETVTGGGGADWVWLGGATGQSVTATGIETLVSGAHDDAVTLAVSQTGAIVNLLGGSDSLVLADGGNSLSVFNVESLVGGAGTDTVSLGGAGATTATVQGVETLTGMGDAARWVTLSGPATVTASGIDTLVGSAGDDRFEMAAAATGAIVNGLGGDDSLVLSSGSNLLTVYNIETVFAGAGSDTVRLAGATGQTVALEAVETTVGTAAADQVTVLHGLALIEGAGGADRLVLTGNGGFGIAAYGAQSDGGGFGSPAGHDIVTGFDTGTVYNGTYYADGDRLWVVAGSSLEADLDTDGNGTLSMTSRGQGAVNLSADEMVYLTQAVATGGLESAGFADLLSALGGMSGTGTALVLANDGTSSGLYYLDDFGTGNVAAGNVRMLALFQNAVLQAADIWPG